MEGVGDRKVGPFSNVGSLHLVSFSTISSLSYNLYYHRQGEGIMGDGPVLSVKLPLTARPHFIRFSRFTSLIPPTAPSQEEEQWVHSVPLVRVPLFSFSYLLCVAFVRTK